MRILRSLITPQLHAFLVAGERRSTATGACALHISESGLKQRIARLEELLGVELVVRGSRPLRLSPAGGRLLVFAASIRDQCENLTKWMQNPNAMPAENDDASALDGERGDAKATIALLEQANELLNEAIVHSERRHPTRLRSVA